ncbi:hypothetical protein J7J00_23200 [Bacillus sp. ISL-4]|uniref:hypothetical protein n=1 Tax=Bacillus sp. ISL-4 TaxID=2819125 RepID=UPI001BECC732|nr:hypothetical protein [Bacillus sp. ISL-4]MBT2668351.1 hypothetical protein [Bacillus sp. ISL-4]MBT2674419.1 hypothetical protein [Streptomyces sp. ISL-14]
MEQNNIKIGDPRPALTFIFTMLSMCIWGVYANDLLSLSQLQAHFCIHKPFQPKEQSKFSWNMVNSIYQLGGICGPPAT